jgi:hypothetical protein
MNDYDPGPYNSGKLKYSTALAIYDGLCEMLQSEEMGIINDLLREEAPDVSWDNQDFLYTYKAGKLKERWDELYAREDTGYMLELALSRIDDGEVHDAICEMLRNPELAKRVGFKRLFVKNILSGDGSKYAEILEEFEGLIDDLDRYDYMGLCIALYKALEPYGYHTKGVYTYPLLANAVCKKLQEWPLAEEIQLLVECRGLLISYDDFLFGLRANQALFNEQKLLFEFRLRELQTQYEAKVRALAAVADTPLALGGAVIGATTFAEPIEKEDAK